MKKKYFIFFYFFLFSCGYGYETSSNANEDGWSWEALRESYLDINIKQYIEAWYGPWPVFITNNCI